MAMLIIAGWGRSLIVDRYVTACAPALMLALVTVASGAGARLALVGLSGAVALYAAAAEPIGDVTLLWRAAKWLGVGASIISGIG